MLDVNVLPFESSSLRLFLSKFSGNEFLQSIAKPFLLSDSMSPCRTPGPHAVDTTDSYRKVIPGYMQRHQFKGLGWTGLAPGWKGGAAKR